MATQLVPLPEVERLSASVVRILGGNPGKFTLQGTNTYLVGRGPQRLLIDTGQGFPAWANSLKTVLLEEKATVQKALITHWHHDHVKGIPDLLKICPQARVYKHQPDEGQANIEDGQVFQVEGATVRAFHTPGHTVDHMAFILEEEDAIFSGDNVLGHGTAVFEDLKVYLTSLHKMQNRVSGRAYPGHGAVIEKASAKITDYIRHRQQREEEVLRVLRTGSVEAEASESGNSNSASQSVWTPLELVKVIYRDVPESLHLPASHGVAQILQKLESEGKVEHHAESGGWSLSNGRPAL